MPQTNINTIAILMASYNGEKYIQEQINSILAQTYPNWILYINDDSSKDSTPTIIEEYALKYPQKIVVMRNNSSRHGATENFADLFSKVPKADYYVFCDQDDTWEPQKLETMLPELQALEGDSQKPALVYCQMNIVDQNLRIISPSLEAFSGHDIGTTNHLEKIILNSYVPGCAMMFNHSLKKIIGTIPPEVQFHDWWVLLVAAACGSIKRVNFRLANYRQHLGNTIGITETKSSFSRFLSNMSPKQFKRHAQIQRNNRKQAFIQASLLLSNCKDFLNPGASKTIQTMMELLSCKNKLKSIVKGWKYPYLHNTFYEKFIYWWFTY